MNIIFSFSCQYFYHTHYVASPTGERGNVCFNSFLPKHGYTTINDLEMCVRLYFQAAHSFLNSLRIQSSLMFVV